MPTRHGVALGLVIGLVGAGVAVGQIPVPVSPGSAAGELTVESRCPTFSWAPQGVAEGFEVRVHNAVPVAAEEPSGAADAAALEGRAILRARVPGTATSWTPSQPQCLEPGASYLWTVAASDLERATAETAAPLRFRVAAPTLPPAIARGLLETIDRLLLEGGLEPAAATALLRSVGLVEPSRTAAGPDPGAWSPEPAATGAGPAFASFPPVLDQTAILADFDAFECEGCNIAAIRGRGSLTNGLSIGVLGEASHTVFSPAPTQEVGVYGWATAQGGTGVFGEGLRGVHGTAVLDGLGGFFENTGTGTALKVQGKGQQRSKAALRVDNSQPTQGMAAYLTNASSFANTHLSNTGSGQVLYLQNGGDAAGTGGGSFIEARSSDEMDIQFRVASDGTAFSDTSFNGGGADFAEMMLAAEQLEAGEVLIAGGDGRVERVRRARDPAVVGVHSTAPGFLGGAGPNQDLAGQVPVAIVGIVPVRVTAENGPIAPGDLLVSAALPGHAMRASEPIPTGAVLGKALEALAEGRGVIRVLLAGH